MSLRDAPPPSSSAASPGPRRAVFLVASLVISGFLLSMLSATGGRFVPQVVDLYLVCQYAKAFAEGHPFQYNPGEPPSTGATSLLYTAWLGLLHALGARGEWLIAAAIATGIVLYLGSVSLAFTVALRLGSRREAVLAAILVALCGPMVWSFLYGSDIALFLFLVLLLLDRWLAAADSGRFSGAAVAGTLLAMARPEGLPLGILLGAAAFFDRGSAALRQRCLMLLPVVAGGLVLTLQRVLAGSWLGTSVVDKALFANYAPADALALIAEYVTDFIRGVLFGFYPSQIPLGFARGFAPFYLPPLALLLVALAAATSRPPYKRPLQRFLVAAGLVAVLAGMNMFMGVHFNRYVIWTLPFLLVTTAVGLGQLSRHLSPADATRERAIFRAAASIMVVLGLLSTVRFAALYGDMAGEVARRELPMAEWIGKNLPRGVRIANLATSIEYLTGQRNLNLHGVTSPAFFGGRTAEREAGLFEGLCRLPEDERPGYLLSSVAVQESSALFRELVVGPPLFRTTSLGDELLLFRLSFDLPGRNATPLLPETTAALLGREQIDRLNVGDGKDEAAHAYSFESRLGNLRLHGSVRIDDYVFPDGRRVRVADAGRAILGRESFRVRTRGGRVLFIVMRTAPDVEVGVLRSTGSSRQPLEIPEGSVLVSAAGHAGGRVVMRPGTGWSEVVLAVPAEGVVEGSTELTLSGRYASFHFWFYQ